MKIEELENSIHAFIFKLLLFKISFVCLFLVVPEWKYLMFSSVETRQIQSFAMPSSDAVIQLE